MSKAAAIARPGVELDVSSGQLHRLSVEHARNGGGGGTAAPASAVTAAAARGCGCRIW